MPTAWRIVKEKHVSNAFDGDGARLFGGRWNSPGTRMVYTSESRSLAALELLVHVQSSEILSRYMVVSVHFLESLVEILDPALLPSEWRESPPKPTPQSIGDDWINGGQSVILKVPSVVIDDEHNYLLNPAHPDFEMLDIDEPERFEFDQRFADRPRRAR